MRSSYSFSAELWRHEGGSWYFVSVPVEAADEIESITRGRVKAFGSVRVDVTIGSTHWSTSIFPDTKRETYVLPVKQSVRAAEGLQAGSTARVELTVAKP